MSLVDISKENYILLKSVSVPDGRGGKRKSWVDGDIFKAAITYNNSLDAKKAQTLGVKDLYTVTTTKDINLKYHDVFRSEINGDIFRVTTKGDYNKTPKPAGLNMRQVDAEEWTLPEDDENG